MNNRHPRGRGWILDYGDVSRGSFISKDSVVKDRARVRDATLINQSCAADDSQILGGTLDRAYVGGKTITAGNPLLCDQTIAQCRSISGAPKIYSSVLTDIVEIWDTPQLVRVHLREGVYVYGDAKLFGPWELGGFARIHEGTWMRPPRYVKLEHAVVTECIEGRLLVECRCRTREWWLKFGPDLAQRDGWSEAQIEATMTAVRNFDALATVTGGAAHVEDCRCGGPGC